MQRPPDIPGHSRTRGRDANYKTRANLELIMSSSLNPQERLSKLEHTSEEAEKILRQLKVCVQVLEEKSRMFY